MANGTSQISGTCDDFTRVYAAVVQQPHNWTMATPTLRALSVILTAKWAQTLTMTPAFVRRHVAASTAAGCPYGGSINHHYCSAIMIRHSHRSSTTAAWARASTLRASNGESWPSSHRSCLFSHATHRCGYIIAGDVIGLMINRSSVVKV